MTAERLFEEKEFTGGKYRHDTATPDLEYKHRQEPNASPLSTFNAYRNASGKRAASEEKALAKAARSDAAGKAPAQLRTVIDRYATDSPDTADSDDNVYAVTEALFISSLIGTGSAYDPARYGITDEMITKYPKVHAFCKMYQAKAGSSPPIRLVHSKHPAFYYTEGIDPGFAAELLHGEHKAYLLRSGIHKALKELADHDNRNPEVAARHMTDAVKRAASVTVSEAVSYDQVTEPDQASVLRVPLDPPGDKSPLTELTRGIGVGELHLLAARFGVGKTFRLIWSTLAACAAGHSVHFYSMEMTRAQIADRMDVIALRDTDVDLADPKAVIAARRQWLERCGGSIRIHDPSKGAPSADRISGEVDKGELVVLDYIGKMRSSTGKRAKEDFREMALIAQELKELALTAGIPILSAAQINREGVRDSDGGKAHHLAQSDDLGQEADVIHIMSQYAPKVHMNVLAKNRYGEQGKRWFSHFDPSRSRFGYCGAEEAERLKELGRDERQM